MNCVYCYLSIMKDIIKITFLVFIVLVFVATGCTASKEHKCGCTGMVGYK